MYNKINRFMLDQTLLEIHIACVPLCICQRIVNPKIKTSCHAFYKYAHHCFKTWLFSNSPCRHAGTPSKAESSPSHTALGANVLNLHPSLREGTFSTAAKKWFLDLYGTYSQNFSPFWDTIMSCTKKRKYRWYQNTSGVSILKLPVIPEHHGSLVQASQCAF